MHTASTERNYIHMEKNFIPSRLLLTNGICLQQWVFLFACWESETSLERPMCFGVKPGCYCIQLQSWFGSICFLMYLPTKTQVQRLRVSFTEAVPGPDFQSCFCKDGNLRGDFWLVNCARRHAVPQNPLCKIAVQIKIVLLLSSFGQIKKKCALKPKMPVCLRSQGC